MIPGKPFRALIDTARTEWAIRRRDATGVAACLAKPLPPAATGRPRVLYLAKPIFNDDVAALRRFGGQFEYVPLPAATMRRIYYSFVSTKYRHNHTSYYRDGNLDEREAYFEFVRRVLAAVRDRHAPVAVLSANYNYCWQQELARACVECDLPLVVLHKEGICLAGNHEESVAEFSNGRFVGDAMLVYNDATARALRRVPLDGLTADRISVVGVPRLDSYVKRPAARGTAVAFFSFQSYVPPRHATQADAIDRRIEEFCQLPLRFAERHPEREVILKFKKSDGHARLLNAVRARYGRRVPTNVTITSTAATEPIIRRACAVVSWNSTTLIEGLLAGRRLVSPRFDDVVSGGVDDCFSSSRGLIARVATLEEFESAVLDERRVDVAAAAQLLHEVIGGADGAASERAEAALSSILVRRGAAA